MIGSGVFEIEIAGKTVGFQFGMLASGYTEEAAGISIFEVFQKIGSGTAELPLIHYFYGGARAYNEFRNVTDEETYKDAAGNERKRYVPRKVTVPLVSTYLEELGVEKAVEIYLKSIDAYVPKNGIAPEMTGQEV